VEASRPVSEYDSMSVPTVPIKFHGPPDEGACSISEPNSGGLIQLSTHDKLIWLLETAVAWREEGASHAASAVELNIKIRDKMMKKICLVFMKTSCFLKT
jgi:hypothetical protein